MQSFQLITSNPNKVDEYRRDAAALGVKFDLVAHPMEIPELQSEDLMAVMRSKIAFVKTRTRLPFIVDDTVFVTERYKNFPGTNAKFVNASLGVEGWKRLFDEGDAITAMTTIGLSYLDRDEFFTGRLDGVLSFKYDGSAPPGAPINALFFVPDRQAFLADLVQDNGFENHRKKAFKQLFQFLQAREEEERQALDETARRWDKRAETWSAVIQDKDCFVNHEDGYRRFAGVIDKLLPNLHGQALDIGCGEGSVARQLADNPHVRVTGIDVSADMLRVAERDAKPNLTFVRTALDGLAPDRKFDLIVSRGIVLSHLPCTTVCDFLSDATARAKPGATFVFDFLQRSDNGDFPSQHPLNVFTLDRIRDLMRELGWAPVMTDGSEANRVLAVAFHKSEPDTIYFATGNPHKMEELSRVIGAARKKIAFCGLEVDEIKSDDLEKIVADKLKRSYELVQRPVLCTDGGVFIEALRGFPGANSKQAARKLGAEGLLKLLAWAVTRRAIRRNCIGYYDGTDLKSFTSEIACDISLDEREMHPAYELDKILIPLSDQNPKRLTYAEIPIKDRVALTELPALAEFVRRL